MTEKEALKKGFNQGYRLCEHDLELAIKLSKGFTQPYNSYSEGFTNGVLQKIKEKTIVLGKNLSLDII